MRRLPELLQALVLSFVGISILWRGGKSLDMIWISVGVFSIVSVAAFFIARKRGEAMTIPRSAWWLSIFFFLWTGASYFFSSSRNYGFDEVLLSGVLTLALWWGASEALRTRTLEMRLARVIAVSCLIAAGIGFVIYTFQPVSRFVGTFFDYRFHTDYWPNAWAEFLLLAFPLVMWALFEGRKAKKGRKPGRNSAFLPSLVLGLLLGCLFLSFSRGGIIAFVCEILLLGLLTFWCFRFSLEWWRVLGMSTVVIVVASGTFFAANHLRSRNHTTESVVRKVTLSSAEGMSSVNERRDFWRQSLVLLRERPLFGWGPYSFRFVQPHLQTRVLETSDHAHNVLLKFAAERGVPAALFFLFLFLAALFHGLCRALTATDPSEALLMLAFVTGLCGVFAHNLIDYNLQFVGIVLPMWLIMGILLRSDVRRKGMNVAGAFGAFLASVLLVLTLIEGSHLVLSSRARRAEAKGDFISALGFYKASLHSSLFPRDGWLSMSAILLGLNDLPEAESAANAGLALNSQDGRAWRVLGDIYLRWNKTEDALRACEKAYTYSRYNDVGITRGLTYLLLTKEKSTLDDRHLEFNGLIDDFLIAIQNNTHFIALSRYVEELVSLCDLLARAYPEDAKSYKQVARSAQEKAREERLRYAARPRGILW